MGNERSFGAHTRGCRGGLAFGLIEVLGQSAPGLGSGYAGAIAFVVLVIVLVVRPRGLLGRLA